MNWREIPNISRAQWTQVLRDAGSPLAAVADETYKAALPLTALALAQMHVESQFGTSFAANPVTNRNVLNLRPRGGLPGFQSFASWQEGVEEYRKRLLDIDYAYAHTTTLRDLIHVFAPSSDGNNEAEYVASIECDLARWGVTGEEPMPDNATVVFGRVPKPAIIELICPKPFEGAGFYRVGPRQNVGVCEHITDGHGSIEFYHAFFSTGGERATDALVDFVIGRDGRIAMLNDWRGTRAPWANGNKLGMEGDGPAFYQRFGVEGIDQKLVSIEHEGTAAEDWPAAMWNAAVSLDAWLFDQMGVRFDSYPVHQRYGVVTHMLHSEFTNKGGNALDECPGRYLKQHITAFQSDVRAVLMAHQVVASEPEPPVKPPVDITPKPFKGFRHGLETRTDQHDGPDTYYFISREFKVAPGRKAQRRREIGKDALIVSVLPEGTKVKGAFLTRQDDLDWLIDESGYAYQANAFNPKFALPLKKQAA